MRLVWGLVGLSVLCLLIAALWEAAPPLPNLSPAWVSEEGQLLHVRLTSDERWRLPLSDEALRLIEPLILAKEDRHFYWHLGVDPMGLARAAWVMLRGGPRQGGSTIPMQTAQLLRPGPRNLWQKLRQMFYATALSIRYDKQTLLRLYLTIAPFGKNIEGLEAAAQYYFQKSAKRLTPLEIAALFLISQRPSLTRAFLVGEESFRQRALFWVRFWKAEGCLSEAELRQAEETPLRPTPRPFPFLDPPPLALQKPHRRERGEPPETLYLSPRLQAAAHRLLQAHLRAWESCGIQEGNLLIVEIPTGKVRAYIGSRAYRTCAIDLLQVRRSPGSTLKPFLWVMALQEGLIHSEMPLVDLPLSYEGFLPTNFQKDRYEGQVSARRALYESLNVPAIDLLRRVGEGRFLEGLRRLELPTDEEAGLSVIIGGQSVRAWQLAQAYTTLGTGGQLVSLRLRNRDSLWVHRVLDSGAVAIVRRMLPSVGWGWVAKTGTSSRLRDAWCIAVSARYVVLVWIGNPDASPSGCLKARELLWPLMQRIVALLPVTPETPLPISVKGLTACPLTGLVADSTCPQRVEAWACEDHFPVCQHWDTLYVWRSITYRPSCADSAAKQGRRLIVERIPLEAALWWGKWDYQRLPPLSPKCAASGRLLMLMPLERVVVWLRRHRPRPLSLQAISDMPGPIHWWIGAQYLGSQSADKAEGLSFWPPTRDTTLTFFCGQGTRRLSRNCRIRWMD